MNRELRGSLAWGLGILLVALCGSYARKVGYVDNETVTRVVIGMNGLMIAWWGNLMPKAVAPNAWMRQAKRVGGWSMFLSGVLYTGLWAFAPIPVAVAVGSGAVIAGVVVTLGYCLLLRNRAKTG